MVTESASGFSSPSRSQSSVPGTPLLSPPKVSGLDITNKSATSSLLRTARDKRKHEATDDDQGPAKHARKGINIASGQSRPRARAGVLDMSQPGSPSNDASVKSLFPSKPSECPGYVEKVWEICESVSGVGGTTDARWNELVKAWLRREVKAKYAGGKFVTKSRPGEVGQWIQSARPTKTFKPVISLNGYTTSFAAWWDNMQPEGRTKDEDLFMGYSREEKWTWDKLVFGVNGAVNVMVALAWWRRVVYNMKPKGYHEVQSAELEQEKFEQAVDMCSTARHEFVHSFLYSLSLSMQSLLMLYAYVTVMLLL